MVTGPSDDFVGAHVIGAVNSTVMEADQVWLSSKQDHGKEDKLGSRKAKVEKRKRDNGSTIAWFKDPAGNILSVIEETAKP